MRSLAIKTQNSRPRTANPEPLAESIQRKKHRSWKSMTDIELVAYAKRFMKENGIKNRSEFSREDCSLYITLRKRGVLNKIEFQEKHFWAVLSDKELIDYAKEIISKDKIKCKKNLQKKFPGLHGALWKRKLLDKVGLNSKQNDWSSISNKDIVNHTHNFIKKTGIRCQNDLRKLSHELWAALKRRNLLKKIEFIIKSKKRQDYLILNDEELVSFSIKFMRERNIRTKTQLIKTKSGLYNSLKKRGLIEKIDFDRKTRNWASMDNREIIQYANEIIKKKGFGTLNDLDKEDTSLIQTLRRRGILDQVIFKHKKRKLSSKTDSELIECAKKLITFNNIKTRSNLQKEDGSLYGVLLKRNLLDIVFAENENFRKQATESRTLVGLSQAADAMEKFGDQE